VGKRGRELVGIGVEQTVLDRPAGRPAGSDENEGLAPERLHEGHLLVQRQLRLVELDVLKNNK
jgi:hypothetical protein